MTQHRPVHRSTSIAKALIVGISLTQCLQAAQPDPNYSGTIAQTSYKSDATHVWPGGGGNNSWQQHITLDPGKPGPLLEDRTYNCPEIAQRYRIEHVVLWNDCSISPSALWSDFYFIDGTEQLTAPTIPSPWWPATPLQRCPSTKSWTDSDGGAYTFYEDTTNTLFAAQGAQLIYLYGFSTAVYYANNQVPPTQVQVPGISFGTDGSSLMPLAPGGSLRITPTATLADPTPVYDFEQSPFSVVASPPGYNYFAPIAPADTGSGGWSASLRFSIVNTVGTDMCGLLFQNGNMLSILAETEVLVPQWLAGSGLGTELHLRQDVGGAQYIYEPATLLLPEQYSYNGYVGHSSRPNTSSGVGNDATTADNSPDVNGSLFMADAPGFSLAGPKETAARNGSIIKFRLGLRQWLTVGNVIVIPLDGSGWATWNFDITIKKLSDPAPGVPIAWRLISASFAPGDGEAHPAFIDEMRQIYLSNP